jgi:3-dehydroquinate synthase
VPTTLLAAVDSSVGGKTAIDLPAGKNLAGAFYQPKLVVCDTACLSSLPKEVFLDGCAEVIKYGILYDHALFNELTEAGPAFDRDHVIARCVELKRDVVANDEFDRGQRQKLNLGHTMGHGIEAESHFTISHGKAVAIGMSMICRCAARRGLCTEATAQQVISVLQQFGLPTSTDTPADAIYSNALSDKKRSGGIVNLIVPLSIGDCRILPVSTKEVKAFIEEGL